VSEEEARRFVWGPWEFNTGTTAQATGNRTTRPRPYSRADGQNWDRLSLARTRPGHWMSISQEHWQKQIQGPVRLQTRPRAVDLAARSRAPHLKVSQVRAPRGRMIPGTLARRTRDS
jgi:hypothetical protein